MKHDSATRRRDATAMRSVIQALVVLACSILAAPPAAEGEPPTKIPLVDVS